MFGFGSGDQTWLHPVVNSCQAIARWKLVTPHSAWNWEALSVATLAEKSTIRTAYLRQTRKPCQFESNSTLCTCADVFFKPISWFMLVRFCATFCHAILSVFLSWFVRLSICSGTWFVFQFVFSDVFQAFQVIFMLCWLCSKFLIQ